jgi:hypothetical protein
MMPGNTKRLVRRRFGRSLGVDFKVALARHAHVNACIPPMTMPRTKLRVPRDLDSTFGQQLDIRFVHSRRALR